MSTIEIPVLFDCSGGSVKILGESLTDVVDSHLEFTISAVSDDSSVGLRNDTANRNSSTQDRVDVSVNLFDGFMVGDTDNTTDKFFYAKNNDSVRKFANTLADILIYGKYNQTTTDATKNVPLGKTEGSGDDAGKATKYGAAIAAAGDTDVLANVMTRVAAVHLAHHPLSQVVFTNEDDVATQIVAESDQNASDGTTTDKTLTSDLAYQIYEAFSGEDLETAHKVNAAANGDWKQSNNSTALSGADLAANTSGGNAGSIVTKSTGVDNLVLKSILEQLIDSDSTRASDMSGIHDLSANSTQTKVGKIPFKTNDKIVVYIRPTITLDIDGLDGAAGTTLKKIDRTNGGLDDVVLTNADNSSAEGNAEVQTLNDIFPAMTTANGASLSTSYGWIGHGSSGDHITQERTNLGAGILDCHIWKVTITLGAD